MATNRRHIKQNNRVLLALSGGIDSAVSAVLLMRAGFEVEAAFMKNWSSTQGLLKSECPWIEDRREALKVAAQLGIPLHTFDFEDQYRDTVMQYFFEEYAAGRTPNPDVMCNKEIKFKLLYDKAMQMGFQFFATGHYARIGAAGKPLTLKQRLKMPTDEGAAGKLQLLRARDEFKDQTYFIYSLRQEQLARVLFPVGSLLKSEVRKLARKLKLPNADRKESMGLCFVGKIRLDDFLRQRIPAKRGNIIDVSGKKLGEHEGVAHYTVGQREGLGIGGTGPYYVVKKDTPTNTLVVSADPNDRQLLSTETQISGTHWITRFKALPFSCKGRFRHQQKLQDIVIESGKNGVLNAKFSVPQRAIASGQSLVLYKGQICLGGGVIA